MIFLKKILLLDYEPCVVALVRQAFEATGGYEIKEETSRSRSLHTARWFQPDLILSDLSSTPSHTDELTRQLEADPALRDTPMLFLRVESAAAGGVISAGVLSGYSFLAHPIRLEDLVHYVADLLHLDPVRQASDALAG